MKLGRKKNREKQLLNNHFYLVVYDLKINEEKIIDCGMTLKSIREQFCKMGFQSPKKNDYLIQEFFLCKGINKKPCIPVMDETGRVLFIKLINDHKPRNS